MQQSRWSREVDPPRPSTRLSSADDLPNIAALYKRFPGVEGSLYFVGGFGVNYVQRDGTALAPVRFGVGWRQGIALSYMNFSQEKRYNPL